MFFSCLFLSRLRLWHCSSEFWRSLQSVPRVLANSPPLLHWYVSKTLAIVKFGIVQQFNNLFCSSFKTPTKLLQQFWKPQNRPWPVTRSPFFIFGIGIGLDLDYLLPLPLRNKMIRSQRSEERISQPEVTRRKNWKAIAKEEEEEQEKNKRNIQISRTD